MTKTTIYFGTEFTGSKKVIDNRETKLNRIKAYLQLTVKGYTWLETFGYYEDTQEKAVKLELFDLPHGREVIIAQVIKKALDQESVLVTSEHVNGLFV